MRCRDCLTASLLSGYWKGAIIRVHVHTNEYCIVSWLAKSYQIRCCLQIVCHPRLLHPPRLVDYVGFAHLDGRGDMRAAPEERLQRVRADE